MASQVAAKKKFGETGPVYSRMGWSKYSFRLERQEDQIFPEKQDIITDWRSKRTSGKP